jgi:hypothetical protein
VADSALTEAESALLRELTDRGVRFLIVGASAAVIQGANTATQDIDLTFSAGDASTRRQFATARVPHEQPSCGAHVNLVSTGSKIASEAASARK